ncbi:MAG: DNA-processing protein DprA [Lachnospiraceae bacterium]|nr:DNA-processing protein DprA [Ruminococcus sp.]MCM1275613.1 DNA-processing protein DprA [Lachnospiraceae bacterium]
MMKNKNASMIAVLCSYLCAKDCRPFEPSEWTRIADALRKADRAPDDIPDMSDDDMKQYLGFGESEIERVKRLLDRSAAIAFKLADLSSSGIKVVTRADDGYPKALKKKLRGACPPLFYCSGDLSLLRKNAVGYVGSRSVNDSDMEFTKKTVAKTVAHGYGAVSGGARGTDSTACAAALENGSFCIEFVADSLERRIRKREVINAIQEKRLLLISLAVPDAGFNVGMAMTRNKFIYAQSKAAVVVKSDYNKGGTWSGACEALKKKLCTVFCRDCRSYAGNTELIKLGAVPIDDTWDGDVGVFSDDSRFGEQLTFFTD